MIEVLRFFLVTFLIGIVFSIPGLIIGLWLAKNGLARLATTSILVVSVCLTFVKQVWYGNISWWPFGILMLLATTIGVNRADLSMTFKKGKWWWKSEEYLKKD